MGYLTVGEWWTAPVFMACAFVVAAVGVVGLAWWVLRGERLNRAATESDRMQEHRTH